MQIPARSPKNDDLSFLPHLVAIAISLLAYIGRWNFGRISIFQRSFEKYVEFLDLRLFIIAAIVFLTYAMYGRSKVSNAALHIGPWEKRSVTFTVAFLTYMMFSVLWTPKFDVALPKLIDIFLLLIIVWSVRYVTLLPSFPVVKKSLQYSFLLISTLLGILGLGAVSSTTRLSVLGGGPNVYGRLVALGGLCGLRLERFTWLGYTATAFLSLAVLLSGSRGAAGAYFVALILYFVFGKAIRFSKKLVSAVALVVIGTLLVSQTELGRQAADRMESRVRYTLDYGYVAGRDILYDQALSLWKANPIFGLGIGGWNGVGFAGYPHNMFLEIGCEGGWIGVLLLAGSQLSAMVHYWKKRQLLDPLFIAIWLLYFVASQMSGDIYDSRNVFIFTLLSLRARV